MMKTLPFERVKEGTTEVFVLKQKSTVKGPGIRRNEPFYNPAMELSRDLSILVNQWFITTRKKPAYLLDGLAASGIRGVRLAHEIDGDFEVVINDWDDQAYALIQKNITYNKLANANASQNELNMLLSGEKFHSIDIDPFGSPAYFIDAALRNIQNNGILACSATDTAPLCGVYPLVCLRRYGAYPFHSPMMREIGLRILLGLLCREAAKYDKAIEPFLCHATDYYFRVYVQVKQGKNAANQAVEHMSYISKRTLKDFSGNDHITGEAGPLWMGKIQRKNIVEQLRTNLFTKQLNSKHELWKLLQTLEEEADAPPLFYTMETIGARMKTSIPKREKFFEEIQQKGFQITRTHCTPTGFKTTAPLEEIEKIFKKKIT